MGLEMTDRELLELAAKAAGTEIFQWVERDEGQETATVMPYGFEWNPLTDDGDALRLAVKLGLTVDAFDAAAFDDSDKDTPATRVDDSNSYMLSVEPHQGDPYAATRRAIVRAAAEIGKIKNENN
jgi:hypothetical protein